MLKKYSRIIISVILLALVLKFGLIDIKQFSDTLKNPLILVVGLAAFSLQICVFAWRWKSLVNLEESRYPLTHAIRETLIGSFFNFFIPSGVGGDVVKALSLSEKYHVPKKSSFALITVDRVLGLFALILFSTVFLFIEFFKGLPENMLKLFNISLLLLILACCGLLFLYHSKKIFPKIKTKIKINMLIKLIQMAEQIQLNIEKILKSSFFLKIIGISFISQCLSIGFLYFVNYELNQTTVSIFVFLPLACFAFMASAIPLTPAGIGVGQAAFFFIFSMINPPTATAVSTAISLMQFFNLILSLPGGYFFARSKENASTHSLNS